MTKRILILAANPKKTDPLLLGKEVQSIQAVLERSKQRSQFERPIQQWAVTPGQMQEAILTERPHVVHFSGHGTREEGIVLEGENGYPQLVSTRALAKLFELCNKYVECVLLNACYSEVQAQVICRHIPYVVGMRQTISDEAAIQFSLGFYRALGAGENYDRAYEFGCNSIDLEGIPEADRPQLKQSAVKTLSTELPAARVLLHGWKPVPENKESFSHELDWTTYFQKYPTRLPNKDTWEHKLVPHLKQLQKQIVRTYASPSIEVHSTLPLSAILAFGFHFSERQRYCLQIQQNSSYLWRSDAAPLDIKFNVVETMGHPGNNLLIALAISQNVSMAVCNFFEQPANAFDAMVYAEPAIGTGQNLLKEAGEVTALANHARTLIEHYRRHYQSTCMHLILVTPAAFALFLGMRLNALGEIIAYEWIMEEKTYQPLRISC